MRETSELVDTRKRGHKQNIKRLVDCSRMAVQTYERNNTKNLVYLENT